MRPLTLLALSLVAAPNLVQAAFVNLTPVPSPTGSSTPLNPSTDPSTYFYITTRVDSISNVSEPDPSEEPPAISLRSDIEIIDETARIYSENALKKARMQMATGNFQAVLESINQALTYDPRSAEAVTLQGIISAKRGRYGAAVTSYTTAIGYDPEYHHAFQSRAIARSKLKQFDAAIQDFDQVVRLAPTFPDVYHKRGLLLAQQGRFEAALEDFNTYIKLRPNERVGYNNKVAALVKLGRKDEAEEVFAMMRKVRPQPSPPNPNR